MKLKHKVKNHPAKDFSFVHYFVVPLNHLAMFDRTQFKIAKDLVWTGGTYVRSVHGVLKPGHLWGPKPGSKYCSKKA